MMLHSSYQQWRMPKRQQTELLLELGTKFYIIHIIIYAVIIFDAALE